MIARVVLLAVLVAAGRYAFLRRRRLPLHIVVLTGMLISAAVLVVFPDLSTDLARQVGIGRGVDLVGYVVDLLLMFVALHYYTKFVDLEVKVTRLARTFALREASVTPPEDCSRTALR